MHSGMVIARIKADFGGMPMGIQVAARFIAYFPTEMALLEDRAGPSRRAFGRILTSKPPGFGANDHRGQPRPAPYQGHPAACAAARVALDKISRPEMLATYAIAARSS